VIRKLVQSTLKQFGYRLVRDGYASPHSFSPPAYGLELFFSLLKRYGFDPRHIIDVGANKGSWTRRAIPFFPDACYTLVEPQDHLKAHIQDLVERGFKITWINAGVSDASGTLPFNISNRDDSSTFVSLPGNAKALQISVPVKTLDEIVSAANARPEMVKIDAEGFDLKVLAGASDLFGKTDIFFVEVVICAGSYENSIAKVIQRMDKAGYKVVDITDIIRSPRYGVLWLCELAFLRNASPLFDSATTYE
jgi:FkbM family methyltransferase